ncbi:MAG: aminotransferase class I/II-fold pyridoxal phosphate-dependent enzyme [Rhodospirillales bacterium]|nr:aminotransferase class I/II-fold pyridoxal phosphate-dependent enzyme [Rhodospirillales bacterium]
MKPLFPANFEDLERSGIGKIAVQGLGMEGVYPLWFGEGSEPTPAIIRDAAVAALDAGETFYNNPRGRPDLRAALKIYNDDLYKIDLHPDRIHVPASTMLAVTIAAQMVIRPGDHAVIVTPHWPNVEIALKWTGADIGYYRQHSADGKWALDIDGLMAACNSRTKMIYLNSPCNPTGYVMERPEQERLLDFCRDRGVILLSDEVYHRSVYDRNHAPSFLEFAGDDDPLIVVNGFSKAWAMTGWRIGWMVTPRGYEEQMAVMCEVYNTGAPSFVQLGAIAALQKGEGALNGLRQGYAESLAVANAILGNHARIDHTAPEGAFYAFPRIRGIDNGLAFAEGLLFGAKVGVAPGYTFGPGNETHLRLCFAMKADKLEKALRAFTAYLDAH